MNIQFLRYLHNLNNPKYLLIWTYIVSLQDSEGICRFKPVDVCNKLDVAKHDVHNAIKKVEIETKFITKLLRTNNETIATSDRRMLVIKLVQENLITTELRTNDETITNSTVEKDLNIPQELAQIYANYDKEKIGVINRNIVQVLEKIVPDIEAFTANRRRLLITVNKVKSTDAPGTQNLNEAIVEIVDYLNEKAGKGYRYDGAITIKTIKERLKENRTVEDFKRVIDNKVKDWLLDSEYNGKLRPETLFGNKFESYLNENTVISKQMLLGVNIERKLSDECINKGLEIFDAVYIDKNKTQYIKTQYDNNNMYEFLLKIKLKMEEQKLDVEENKLLDNAKTFMIRIVDPWQVTHLSPLLLNSKFNEIYASLKKAPNESKSNSSEFSERFKKNTPVVITNDKTT